MNETWAERNNRRLEQAGINPAELIVIAGEIITEDGFIDESEVLRIYTKRNGWQPKAPEEFYIQEVESEIYDLLVISGLVEDEEDDIPDCFGFTHQYRDIG